MTVSQEPHAETAMPRMTVTELETGSTPRSTRRSLTTMAVRHLQSYSGIVVLIAIVIVSQVLYPGFLAWRNVSNMLNQNAPIGIIAVGMTFVMIAGGFDLSVGAMYALGAVIFASLAQDMAIFEAMGITLVAGVAGGMVNGVLVAWCRINPFIVTLGTTSVFSGLALLCSGSTTVGVSKPSFARLGNDTVGGIPITVILLAAIFLVGGAVLSRTIYGRSLYAVGGNRDAARLSGLPVNALTASTYALAGACAALGGMMIASRLSVGQADIGATRALDAIAVVVIGGTSLYGGEGAIWRSAVGLLILASLTNLFDSQALDASVQDIVKGAIVIGAVGTDALMRRRRA